MTESRDGCCKVGRVVTEYGLATADESLVEEWRDGKSVRRLAEELNEDLVEAELNAANVSQTAWGRVPVREALDTDELSDAEALQIERELDRAGVDTEKLSSDLVSHQTVYRHLTQCLNAAKGDERTPEERRERARDTVHALQQRTEVVTESTLETLRSAGVADLGDVEVLVDVRVVCGDCGRSMSLDRAIGDGCDCNDA